MYTVPFDYYTIDGTCNIENRFLKKMFVPTSKSIGVMVI